MRLLLVGAFAFPHEQGSQVYFREQAEALAAAGAEVHLLTYGSGRNAPSRTPRGTELPQTVLPAWAAPRSTRSGPNLAKPLADLVLATVLRRLVAAPNASSDASRSASQTASRAASISRGAGPSTASWTASSPGPSRRPGGFDAILAHHAEAALVALHGLPRSRPPVVYCAHTLLEQELPLYFAASPLDRGARRLSPASALAHLGGSIDGWIARRAEGWIALTQTAERVMRASSAAPGRRIGPPLSDPSADRIVNPTSSSAGDPNRSAEPRDDARILAANGLAPRGYFLYCGNLDPYQDLPLLEQVARRRDGARGSRLPLVLATHALPRRCDPTGMQVVAIRSAAEARALFAGARASIVPRRSLGGFPIKLVNSLAAGTPVVAFHGDEWGLVDGHEGLIVDPLDPVASLAEALARLELDPALAERLGRGARARYAAEHRPALAAAATLELIREVVARRRPE